MANVNFIVYIGLSLNKMYTSTKQTETIMIHADLRKLTQEDVNKMVDEEVNFCAKCDHPIDWNVLANDVYNIIDRMRRKDIIDEVYDVFGMINNAIEEYN
jgi:hypothetical protein